MSAAARAIRKNAVRVKNIPSRPAAAAHRKTENARTESAFCPCGEKSIVRAFEKTGTRNISTAASRSKNAASAAQNPEKSFTAIPHISVEKPMTAPRCRGEEERSYLDAARENKIIADMYFIAESGENDSKSPKTTALEVKKDGSLPLYSAANDIAANGRNVPKDARDDKNMSDV